MIAAQEILLAHAGEESLFIFVPLLIVAVLIIFMRSRRDDEDDE